MDTDKEYFIEDLAKSADEILQDVDISEFISEKTLDEIEQKSSHEIHFREIMSLDAEIIPDIDGTVEIRLSDDELEVIADFYPPSENGKYNEAILVEDKLNDLGVVFGADWAIIEETLNRCNNEREQINDVVIARGQMPVHEIPEHIVLSERFSEQPDMDFEDSQSIDFKEIAGYTIVEKGTVLAHTIPQQKGEFGKTVKGELIPYIKENADSIKTLKNTEIQGDKVVAGCDGRLLIHHHTIWVNEIFEINCDVDYRIGNVAFPGDIIINGRIHDGFKVESGGSILCKETLDASEITCGVNLSVHKGIIGRNKGKVIAGGVISTKFIENCYVEAKKSIYVESGILHSVINTLDRLEMGDKSVVVGGKVYAQNGVMASQIGNRIGIKTEIYCGIDFSVNQKFFWIKDKLHAIVTKLSIVESSIKRDQGNREKLITIRDNLKSGIHKLNEAAKSLIYHLDKNEDAKVMVKNTIYPGVYIEICHVSYIVPRELMWVEFSLDKEKGKITVDKLDQAGFLL